MAIPVASREDALDRAGRSVRPGTKVRVPGLPEPVEVQVIDPRYNVLVVLVPGRAGQMMGQMVRADEVDVA
jgi:hypothetical protein